MSYEKRTAYFYAICGREEFGMNEHLVKRGPWSPPDGWRGSARRRGSCPCGKCREAVKRITGEA